MEIPNLKCLIVSNSLSGGGAEVTMTALHAEFLKSGVDSTLVAINQSSATTFHDEKTFELGRSWSEGIFATLKTWYEFRKLLKKREFDRVIVNCELPEMFTAFTHAKQMKIICVEHTSQPWKGRRAVGRIVRFALFGRNCLWVTVVKDQMSVWPMKQIPLYIPNPYIKKNSIENVNKLSERIIFIGRMRSEKRPEWAIKAAIANNVGIDLFGDGNQLEKLRKIYAQNKDVKFLGYREDVWARIQRGVVVVPSEYEGDGMVVIESIAQGFPLLLADNKDLRRFALPDVHYFKGQSELNKKIELGKKSNFRDYLVSPLIQEQVLAERSIEAVVQAWCDLLNNTSHASEGML